MTIICSNPECPSRKGEAFPAFVVSVCVDAAGELVENETVLGAVQQRDAICWNCDAPAVIAPTVPEESS